MHLFAYTSLTRECFGRNKCVRDSMVEIQVLIITCLWGVQVYLSSSLKTQVWFKLVQDLIREASFICDTFIEAPVSRKILLCGAQLEQQVWFKEGMCTAIKNRFGIWYLWRKFKIDSGPLMGTHIYIPMATLWESLNHFPFFFFFWELFKKLILICYCCIFQTIRCRMFLQLLSLHDLHTEVSVSNLSPFIAFGSHWKYYNSVNLKGMHLLWEWDMTQLPFIMKSFWYITVACVITVCS
jgi:hypothetical protein